MGLTNSYAMPKYLYLIPKNNKIKIIEKEYFSSYPMKLPILLLACLLASLSLTSAFNEQTTNNIPLFNLTSGINISPTLIRTKSGSVYFNGAVNGTNISPSYILVDFNPTNSTPILQNISKACDLGSTYYFSKLFYHEETSTLVYYCARNTTLLTLNEDDFSIKYAIPLYLQSFWNETRIFSDGNSLVIIGINGLYTSQANSSEMIFYNMNSKTLTNHFYFKQVVVGFASTDLFKYIITNDFSQPYIVGVTISHFMYVGNQYEIYPISNFTYVSFHERAYFYVTEVFALAGLIITNTDKQLLVITEEGKTALNYTLCFMQNEAGSSRRISSTPVSAVLPYQPLLVRGRGTKTLYANIKTPDNYNAVISLTLDGITLSVSLLFNGTRLQVARGNSLQDDLLLAHIDTPNTFQVLTAQDLNQVYVAPYSFLGVLSTNQSYSILHDGRLYVYNFTNNVLLKRFDLTPPKSLSILLSWYQNVNEGRLYFLNTTSSTNCSLQSINIQTLETSTVWNFADKTFCDATIIQAEFTGRISEAVLRSRAGNFLFITEKYGALNFTIPPGLYYGWVAANFTSLSFYLHAFSLAGTAGYTLSSFAYNPSSGQFEMQGSRTQLNTLKAQYLSYTVGDNKVFTTRAGELSVVDLTSQTLQTYSIPFDFPVVSVLQDNANKSYAIVSESPLGNKLVKQVLLFENGGFSPLPGSNNNSFTGQASGQCSYYIVEDLSLSLQSLKIHNICQNNKQSIIY